ncbi:MAG: hypothetical protein HYS81_03960 [Candidatus Aenigmatarchaeota archaeon]|nr:MAG: hypothetical protein HYS81_03960 [Candidatus Aenigmarchaeota archaeon]
MAEKQGKKIPTIAIVAVGIVILIGAGYFLLGGAGGNGLFLPDLSFGAGTEKLGQTFEATNKIPDTNAFDEANPYGYKNPFSGG